MEEIIRSHSTFNMNCSSRLLPQWRQVRFLSREFYQFSLDFLGQENRSRIPPKNQNKPKVNTSTINAAIEERTLLRLRRETTTTAEYPAIATMKKS